MFLHMSVCPQGKVVTQHALQVVSQHALQVSRGCVSQHALQVVSQHVLQVSGGVYPSRPWRFPGPHPRGSLRGLARGFSRPTPGGSPDHTQRVSRPTPWGASSPTPGGLQAHTRGVSQHALRQTPRLMASAAGGAHPTGMRSCLNIYLSVSHINISFMLFMIPRKIPRNLLCESGC